MENCRSFLAGVLTGQEGGVSVLVSQVTSNVPAALLLPGLIQDWEGVLIGCNLGGMDTFIASMASLIACKQIARVWLQNKRRYLWRFALCNALLLAALLTAWRIFG